MRGDNIFLAVLVGLWIAVTLAFFAVLFTPTKDSAFVQPERYRACLIVKQDELFCLSYERENAK